MTMPVSPVVPWQRLSTAGSEKWPWSVANEEGGREGGKVSKVWYGKASF